MLFSIQIFTFQKVCKHAVRFITSNQMLKEQNIYNLVETGFMYYSGSVCEAQRCASERWRIKDEEDFGKILWVRHEACELLLANNILFVCFERLLHLLSDSILNRVIINHGRYNVCYYTLTNHDTGLFCVLFHCCDSQSYYITLL